MTGKSLVNSREKERILWAIQDGFAADRPTLIHVPIKIGGPSD